jgi:hypothetical protein
MAYDAIVHGANAILYWGTAYLKPVEDNGTAITSGRPRLWQDLLQVARELRALEPALVASPLKPPRVRLNPTYGSIDGAGLRVVLRRVAGEHVLIVVNETGDGLGFTVEKLPPAIEGCTLHRLYSSEAHPITGRRFQDGIRARDVHVYATSRRFEDSTLPRRQLQ